MSAISKVELQHGVKVFFLQGAGAPRAMSAATASRFWSFDIG